MRIITEHKRVENNVHEAASSDSIFANSCDVGRHFEFVDDLHGKHSAEYAPSSEPSSSYPSRNFPVSSNLLLSANSPFFYFSLEWKLSFILIYFYRIVRFHALPYNLAKPEYCTCLSEGTHFGSRMLWSFRYRTPKSMWFSPVWGWMVSIFLPPIVLKYSNNNFEPKKLHSKKTKYKTKIVGRELYLLYFLFY